MDAENLANQLAQLGRQLDEATEKLAALDIHATAKGILAANAKEEYEDALAVAFRDAEGSVEARKMLARLECTVARKASQEAAAEAEKGKSAVRNQQAMVRAINSRIDIGRSLLSREKSLAMVM